MVFTIKFWYTLIQSVLLNNWTSKSDIISELNIHLHSFSPGNFFLTRGLSYNFVAFFFEFSDVNHLSVNKLCELKQRFKKILKWRQEYIYPRKENLTILISIIYLFLKFQVKLSGCLYCYSVFCQFKKSILNSLNTLNTLVQL